jgi:superfamily II DNA helicase RecQ
MNIYIRSLSNMYIYYITDNKYEIEDICYSSFTSNILDAIDANYEVLGDFESITIFSSENVSDLIVTLADKYNIPVYEDISSSSDVIVSKLDSKLATKIISNLSGIQKEKILKQIIDDTSAIDAIREVMKSEWTIEEDLAIINRLYSFKISYEKDVTKRIFDLADRMVTSGESLTSVSDKLTIPLEYLKSYYGGKSSSKKYIKTLLKDPSRSSEFSLINDGPLYDRLKEWRLKKANDCNKPPFTIFHNTTLMIIAHLRPKTQDELMSIYGIGPHKSIIYGAEIIDIVSQI